jgi:hypothetical protein
MTIDSSWIACLKQEVPAAFTPRAPFHPDAVFCDGQIRLMCPVVDEVLTWADYIERQFSSHLRRYLTKGVGCVILAFDDYRHVPEAKSMTQAKRRKHLPVAEFNPRDALPPVVPQGERWASCISNRTFKSKVIQLVVDHLTRHLPLGQGQTLVIDYQGPPVRYYAGGAEAMDGLPPLGEADVKFARYAALYDKLQVDSVDGDSVPIALMHMERGGGGQISILRLETRTGPREPSACPGPPARRGAPKGKSKGSPPAKAGGGSPPAKPDRGPKRVYEYVHVRLIFDALRCYVIPQCLDRGALPSHAGHEIAMLLGLIGLTGTDFTRSLPLLSGKTVYDQLPGIWLRLASAFDPQTRQLLPDPTLDRVVAALYQRKFERHAKPGGLDAVLDALKGSKLSERTKSHLPTRETLHCTVRNVNWLLRCPSPPPSPSLAHLALTSVRRQVLAGPAVPGPGPARVRLRTRQGRRATRGLTRALQAPPVSIKARGPQWPAISGCGTTKWGMCCRPSPFSSRPSSSSSSSAATSGSTNSTA